MGTLINFISQHIHIPLHPARRDRDADYLTQKQLHSQHDEPRSLFADMSALNDQRERAKQQFPCEDKHSFNPHYQHNLISTSPSSTLPSLSSSPSSSPSSAYSSSSSQSSLSRATGVRSFTQDSHIHQHHYTYGGSTSNTNKQEYSYHRRHIRRQNLRSYTYQQQHEHYHDDWMFGITEDDDADHHGIRHQSASSTTSTAFQASSQFSFASSSSAVSSAATSTTGSLRSSLSRKSIGRSQYGSVMNMFHPNATPTASLAASKSATVTFSPVVVEHTIQASIATTTSSPVRLLPSISESSLSSLSSMDSSASRAIIAAPTAGLTAAITAVSSSRPTTATTATTSSVLPHQLQTLQLRSGADRLTATQSLMRISQCKKSDDGWCSQKAGQYTQRYANDSNPRGMKTDGRRACRL
ncbi:hypothetical protein BGZ98_005150 [Dissophora globulifera]|nr:hypothetical protein BGZ98_005150 [Dissophora globulifera]